MAPCRAVRPSVRWALLLSVALLCGCIRFATGCPSVLNLREAGGETLSASKATGRRLTQLASAPLPPPPPPASYYEQLPFRAPVIAVGLINIPLTRRYLLSHRAVNATQALTAGTVDLDTQQTTLINPGYEHFCNGPLILADGRPILVGGYYGNQVLQDGRAVISVYDSATNTMSFFSRMQYNRWYATTCRLANGKVLIVGGTPVADAGPAAPVAELFDPANPAANTVSITMPNTFKVAAGYNWFPFIVQLPRGEVLWWGDRAGSITDSNWALVTDLPALPASFPFRTMYKYTSAVVLLPLKPDASGEYNCFTMMAFGGAPFGAIYNTPASALSARLDFCYCPTGICNSGWVVESMANGKRVMGDATVLPNGKVLYHGGGQYGTAGWKKRNDYRAIRPAANALMYDPDAPLGLRYTLSGSIGIIRMYHSTACLDLTGKLLIAGCDTCGMPTPKNISRSPDGDNEFRMQMGTPNEIASPIVRPRITSSPAVITLGTTFDVSYSYGGTITGATLVAPCSATHSINMNQRVIFLTVVTVSGVVATLRTPLISQPAVAPAGYFILFLLGDSTSTGNTYSEGRWLRMEKLPA